MAWRGSGVRIPSAPPGTEGPDDTVRPFVVAGSGRGDPLGEGEGDPPAGDQPREQRAGSTPASSARGASGRAARRRARPRPRRSTRRPPRSPGWCPRRRPSHRAVAWRRRTRRRRERDHAASPRSNGAPAPADARGGGVGPVTSLAMAERRPAPDARYRRVPGGPARRAGPAGRSAPWLARPRRRSRRHRRPAVDAKVARSGVTTRLTASIEVVNTGPDAVTLRPVVVPAVAGCLPTPTPAAPSPIDPWLDLGRWRGLSALAGRPSAPCVSSSAPPPGRGASAARRARGVGGHHPDRPRPDARPVTKTVNRCRFIGNLEPWRSRTPGNVPSRPPRSSLCRSPTTSLPRSATGTAALGVMTVAGLVSAAIVGVANTVVKLVGPERLRGHRRGPDRVDDPRGARCRVPGRHGRPVRGRRDRQLAAAPSGAVLLALVVGAVLEVYAFRSLGAGHPHRLRRLAARGARGCRGGLGRHRPLGEDRRRGPDPGHLRRVAPEGPVQARAGTRSRDGRLDAGAAPCPHRDTRRRSLLEARGLSPARPRCCRGGASRAGGCRRCRPPPSARTSWSARRRRTPCA